METERKTLTQLSVPICLETLFYMLSGMVDTLMLSSVSDQAVGAVGTANTYIGVFIIMFGVISSGMIAVMFRRRFMCFSKLPFAMNLARAYCSKFETVQE